MIWSKFMRVRYVVGALSIVLGLSGCGGGGGDAAPATESTGDDNTAALPAPSITILASSATVDTEKNVINLLGTSVQVRAETAFSGTADKPISTLSEVRAGDSLSVTAGFDLVTGELVATAVSVQPDAVGDEVQIKANIERVNNNSFTVIGVTIETNADTEFTVVDLTGANIGGDAATFYELAGPGDVVELIGVESRTRAVVASNVSVTVDSGSAGPVDPTPDPGPIDPPPGPVDPTPPVDPSPVTSDAITVEGAITMEFDAASGFLNVAEVPIHVAAQTTITDAVSGEVLAPADLMLGDMVRVAATLTPDLLHADFIERHAGPADIVSFSGPIEALSASASTITMVWGTTAHTDDATSFSDDTGATLTSTQFFETVTPPATIRVRGSIVSGVAQTFLAKDVTVVAAVVEPPPPPPPPVGGAAISAAGQITALADMTAQTVTVSGIEMSFNSETTVTQTGSGAALAVTDLAVGDSVRAAGTVAGGVITITSLTREANPLIGVELSGPLTAIDETASTVEVLGATIKVDAATIVMDNSGAEIMVGDLFAQVAVGVRVRVRAIPVIDPAGAFHATTVEVATDIAVDNEIGLFGTVTAGFNPGGRTVGVFNVSFTLTPDVTVVDLASGSALTPADIGVGDYIHVMGSRDGDVLMVSAVEILAQSLDSVDIMAESDSIDETNETILLFGDAQTVTVQVDDNTTIVDVSGASVPKARLFGALPETVPMSIVGTPIANATRSVLASEIQLGAIEPHPEDVAVEGAITAVDMETLTVTVFDVPFQITQDSAVSDLGTTMIDTPFELTVGLSVKAVGAVVGGVAYLESIEVQASPLTGVSVSGPMTTINANAGTLSIEIGSKIISVSSDASTSFTDVNGVVVSAQEFFDGTPLHSWVMVSDGIASTGAPLALTAGTVAARVILPHNDALTISDTVSAAYDPATEMVEVMGVSMHVMPDAVITDSVNNAPITAEDLALDTPVSVTAFTDGGVIHVTEVEVIAAPAETSASGPVDELDAAAESFVLYGLGISVATDATTEYFDEAGVALVDDFFTVVTAHTQVQVSGTLDAAGGAITATRVDLLP